MELEPFENYKEYDIYKNKNNGYYIVYDGQGVSIAREAVKLFVQNNIDINMKLFSYKTTEIFVKNDIDVDIIKKRR